MLQAYMRHQSRGKTAWRLEVRVIVVISAFILSFIVRIYYLNVRFIKYFAHILTT